MEPQQFEIQDVINTAHKLGGIYIEPVKDALGIWIVFEFKSFMATKIFQSQVILDQEILRNSFRETKYNVKRIEVCVQPA